MTLTIRAIRYKGQLLTPPIEAVLDEQGGTLGRSPMNNLVLADDEKVVSREHASIKHEDGDYVYVDSSSNGTLITNRNQHIHYEKIRLEDQDTLKVGEYELVLIISGKSPETPSQRAHILEDTLSSSIFDLNGIEGRELNEQNDFWNDTLSKKLNNNCIENDSNTISSLHHDAHISIDDSFVPPDIDVPSDQETNLPEDLALMDFFPDEEQRCHSIQKNDEEKNSERTSTFSSSLLSVFFKAAGIEDAAEFYKEDDAALMHLIGMIFRELVNGLMTVLRGRSELKSKLRLSMTVVKPTENNPFKFFPTAEEALKMCLLNTYPGFVGAVEAVREGYDDIMNHQLAVTAGIQASLAGILNQFDPQSFSEKFKEGLVLQKKAKCWDAYRKAYPQIVERAIEEIYGDDFVRAYEAQIAKLNTPMLQKPKGFRAKAPRVKP